MPGSGCAGMMADRPLERPVAAQRRRIDAYYARDRMTIAEQIQKMKIERCEINTGRNGGTAVLARSGVMRVPIARTRGAG
jgi:hypothetical protein